MEPARAALNVTAPAGAEAWVILQRTELAYVGDGEVRRRLCRLIRVDGERGVQEASLVLPSLGGDSSRIKSLKGWNPRPDGEVVRLERADVVATDGGGQGDGYQTRKHTQGVLSRVVPGSWVAFEAVEVIQAPMGPIDVLHVLEDIPIRQWEVRLAKSGGWFGTDRGVQLRIEPVNTAAWPMKLNQGADVLTIEAVPAYREREPWSPAAYDTLPRVHVGFLDPVFTKGPSIATWDVMATWIHQQYALRAQPFEPIPLKARPTLDALKALGSWMAREITYKQVYLTPDRGWIPETSVRVVQKRYGDCKDVATCFMGGVHALGLEAFPTLARIGGGHIAASHPITPYAFNHALAAVRLKQSLGLPAEVTTPGGRFLLVDPTSRTTPLGLLPTTHRRGRVMICTPEGAQWAAVPDSAIETEAIKLQMRGKLQSDGTLKAAVAVEELGDALGLRGEALLSSRSELVSSLARLLRLPADATLEILQLRDPLDLTTPFTVDLAVTTPRAFKVAQGEVILSPIGLPALPSALPQSPGQPRALPVTSRGHLTWDLSLDVEFPFEVLPLFAERKVESPFRLATWSATREGARIQATLRHTWREASFEGVAREQGVREARKDRAALRLMIEEATAFKRPQ